MKEAIEHYNEAAALAEESLIFEARGYMRKLPEGVECIAAMGQLMLCDEGSDYDLPTTGRFADCIQAYLEMFGPTYGPFRFTRIGDVVRDW